MGMRSRLSSLDYARLRGHFDGHEPIMSGLGVAAIRKPERKFQAPEWMNSDVEVADFIRKMFPLAGKFGNVCKCDPCSFPEYRLDRHDCMCRWCRDTMQAARWLVVIYRWFRIGETDTRIEIESRWKPGTVGSIVQKIKRVIGGERQDGLPRTGKPRGRPKKLAIIPDNQDKGSKAACSHSIH